MAKLNVINTTKGPLSFAGVTARPAENGKAPQAVAVDEQAWKSFLTTTVGKTWTERGLLKVEGGSAAKTDKGETDNDDAAKDALISQLAELDVKADRRMSVDTLQAKLDEATAPEGKAE